MNLFRLIISIVFFILILVGVWYGITQSISAPVVPVQIDAIREVTFVDEDKGEMRVVFDSTNNLARVTFDQYQDIDLALLESASGARYANQDTGLVLWNKGEDVVLYLNDEIIFSNTTSYSIEDNTPSEDGNIKTPSDTEIQSYVWVWKETQMNDGTIVKPNKQDQFTLTFNSDNTLSGRTDCNGFGGSYTTNQGQITFGPFMQTLMYCEGSQETEFVRMVTDSTSYIFDTDNNLVLLIKYDSGSVLFQKGDKIK